MYINFKDKFCIILCFLFILQLVNFPQKVEANPPTKTITYTIVHDNWSAYKITGPDTYYYDDGLYYGTLYRINTTWVTRNNSTYALWTQYSDKKSTLEGSPPSSYYHYQNYYENTRGYTNVEIIDTEWYGDLQGPGEFTFYRDGEEVGPYNYKRSFRVYYTHDQFKYTSTYEGTVTARTTPPVIDISMPLPDTKYHNQEKICINGYVQDEDAGDVLEIKYSIVGTSYVDIKLKELVATGNNEYFEEYIQLGQDIEEGEFILKIWVNDDKGADSNVIEIPIQIVNTLNIINEAINSYIPEEKEEDVRIILANTDDTILLSEENNLVIQNIKNLINNRDAQLYFIGHGEEMESYITNYLTTNYGTLTDDNESNIINLAIEEINKLQQDKSNIYIYNEFIDYTFTFEDYEKDYKNISIIDKLKDNSIIDSNKKIPKIIQVRYTHNPNIFDNPVSVHSKSMSNWTTVTDMNDSFLIHQAKETMRGEWTLEVRAKDDTGNSSYDKYSDVKTYNFIIHSKPEAVIEQYRQETDTELYLTAMNSYDIDYQYSKLNNGIKSYLWKYQLEDGTWHNFSEEKNIVLPKVISGQSVINYSLTVEDYHEAIDTTLSSIEEPDEIIVDPKIEAELHSELPEFNSSPITIPSTERLKVTNIMTKNIEPIQNVKFALFDNNGNRRTNYVTLYNPGDIVNGYIIETYWRDIRNYQIPPRDINNNYLRDGNYKARLIATDGVNNLIKDWNIIIDTPIDLIAIMPVKTRTESTVTLTAHTTKYVDNLEVTLYKGTTYETTLSMSDVLIGDNKDWTKDYYVPNTIPEGDYVAEFIATTPNGNIETIYKPFRVESIKLENLRITTVYDVHWRNLFTNPDGSYNGYFLPQSQMPIEYYSSNPIKIGYQIDFAIDSMGLNDVYDNVEIDVEFLDNLGNTVTPKYKDNNDVVSNLPSEYYTIGKPSSKFDTIRTNINDNNATWKFSYFLPATTFVEGEDTLTIKFNIVGIKSSSGSTFDYNTETGFNGRVFTYTLTKSALDDFYIQNGN